MEENLTDKEVVTETNDNGTIENVQIAPIGKYYGSDADGNPVEENITAESLQKIADGLNATETEVLADIDHGASKPGIQRDTKAAGWFTRFVVDPLRGLFASLRLTRHGRELIENREYRYISPTFTLGKDGSPEELHTASLTNLPAFSGFIDPVLNQEANEISHKAESVTDMTKEELVDLIKETVKNMESEKKDEVVEEVKEEVKEDGEAVKEETKEEVVENNCSEVKNEEAETKEEVVEEEDDEEPEEEEKEEVIKIEALNTAPKALADVTKSCDWMNLHGKEFFDYLAKHPEIKG